MECVHAGRASDGLRDSRSPKSASASLLRTGNQRGQQEARLVELAQKQTHSFQALFPYLRVSKSTGETQLAVRREAGKSHPRLLCSPLHPNK